MRGFGATRLELLCFAALLATGAIAATAASATDTTVAPCTAANVSVTLNAQGSTQSLMGWIYAANRGPTACRLSGRPTITIRGGSPGERLVEQTAKPLFGAPGEHYGSLTLAARHAATAQFQWANWCNPTAPRSAPAGASSTLGKRPSGIFVALVPDGAPIRITPEPRSLAYLPVCNAPQDPSRIAVSLWQPFTPS